ncbi:uncharacterized protein LOC112639965 [Camponotus floridanus]|uniref:uncharacterized protein LOC112639965 n=1 Tax=Camponotus floridanus TaxID=104421 RepID=UPI000DC6D083|nr:uncharacterized protein LOC112639965 [Camponotus floridanus]
MEVDAATEMFARADEKNGVSYINYVGDGDCKTFKAIVEQNPNVKKKECIDHVQKRMGTRLRKLVSNTKGLSGRGKLTGKLIDELSIYYGLAIRRHCNSIEDMKKAISLVWSMAPKSSSSSKSVLDIAVNLAVLYFNDGFFGIMQVMKQMGILIGLSCYNFCSEANAARITLSERSLSVEAREARSTSLSSRKDEEHENLEGQLYSPGIAD